MNTQRSSIRPALRQCVLSTVGALALIANTVPARAATMPEAIAIDAQCQPQLSHADAVVYEKAQEGSDSLRRYLSMRQFLLLDTTQAAAWADGVDRLRSSCLVASARGTQEGTTASAAPSELVARK